MNFSDHLKTVQTNWWKLGAGLLLGLMLAALVSALTPRQYTATTTLYIAATGTADSSAAYQGSLLSEQRVKSYTQLVTSDRVSQVAAQTLGAYNLTASDVKDSTSASSPTDSVVLLASATDESPVRAAAISNAVGGAFSRLVAELEQPSDIRQQPAVIARVVDPAPVPSQPVSPRVGLNLALGGILGLASTYIFLLVRLTLDTKVRSDDDIVAATGAPVIGQVPFTENMPERLIMLEKPSSEVAEAIRRIRSNIPFLNVDSAPQAIIVSSAFPEEGKSTTIANLAAALAYSGNSIILVECDLRRPRTSNLLGLPSEVGLTSVLAGRLDVASAVQRTPIDNLSYLSSGPIPPNPSELLGSEHMQNVMSGLRRTYDYILIDAPPILPVADAKSLIPLCDATLFVCRSGKVDRRTLTRAYESVTTGGKTPVGMILTFAKGSSRSKTYSSYYSYDYDNQAAAPRNDGLDAHTDQLGGPGERLIPAADRPSPNPRSSHNSRSTNPRIR